MTGASLSLAVLLCAQIVTAAAAPTLTVGSKRFTESYVLAEVIAQRAEAAGEAAVVRRPGLGNTAIVLHALQTGAIDVYPEYTGTIAREILKLDAVPQLSELNVALGKMGLAASVPLGFNNTYGLAMRAGDAQARGLSRISDLAARPELRLGLSQEFLGRADGWPGLQQAYRLGGATPRGLDHGLAYEALAQGQVDVIDVYSTDAGLEKYGLTVLVDDRQFFPRYDGVLLHRANLPARLPQTWAALETLRGRIDDGEMRRMNVAAERDRKDFAAVASAFLSQSAGAPAAAVTGGLWQALLAPDLARLTLEHLGLVFLSLAASVAFGVPLGILAAKRGGVERFILGATGVVQTVPALALLAFLITLTGRIGAVPAFAALALYALLPIVRNTHAGLTQVPHGLRQAAQALGLAAGTVLRRVELPLALPTIWAGVKTSAVTNVGTATIAAFIGAGGFGERIVTGLAVNDNDLLLAGAIPAAVLALAIEFAFGYGERWVIPAGLRRSSRDRSAA